MAKPTRETVDQWLRQCQSRFDNFKTKREFYDDIVHRDFEPVLDPKLGIEVADYKTPDLEEAEHDFMDIMTMNPTRFSGNLRSKGDKADKAMRDAVLVASHTWAFIENRGRWIDRSNAGGQSRYGVNVVRMLSCEVKEPEYADLDERDEKLREMPWPFYFEDVPVLACSWLDKQQKAEIFAYEVDVPLFQAQREYLVSGEALNKGKAEKKYDAKKRYYPYLEAGKLGWLGEGEVVDSGQGEAERIRCTIIEYRDHNNPCPVCPDKHPLWSGIEVVRAPNAKAEEGEVVQEYTLPYKHAGSFRIVQGRVMKETDPHFKYRPLEFRLLVEATVMNWALTTLQTLANRDSADTRVYQSLAKVPDAAVERIPEEEWKNVLAGIQKSEDPNTIITTLGTIEAWPNQLAPILWEVYRDAADRFERAKPNRFLVGENFDEAAQGTGTANLQSTQQASLPFNWLLAQSDRFILEAKEDQFHAIRYWDYEADEKSEMRYYVSLNGEEPTSHVTAEAGGQVYISASKLAYGFDLMLLTENETLQEQQQKQQMAYEQHDRGWLDAEQVVERLGFHDVDAQMRRLRKYYLRQKAEPMKVQMQLSVLQALTMALADIDPGLAQMVPQQPPAQQPPMQPQQPAQPSVRLPPVEGVQGGASPMQGAMV